MQVSQETALPVAAYPISFAFSSGSIVPMRSCLADFTRCIHRAVQVHPQPDSCLGIRISFRSALGSAAVSSNAKHNVHIGLCTDLHFLFLTLALLGE